MFEGLSVDEKIHELFLKYNKGLIFINRKNISALNEIYRTAKVLESKLSPAEFTEKEAKIRDYIQKVELLFSNECIIPYQPKYNPYLSKESFKLKDDTSILNYLANEGRKMMLQDMCYDEETDLSKVPTVNQCRNSSLNISLLCDDLGIECKVIKISPGYSPEHRLFDGSGYHFITFIYLNSKKYLMDITYSQFFTARNNSLERLGICNVHNCLPGRYMLMNKKRLLVAKKILRDGWIELTDDVLKCYLDGFTLFNRNGLYYEQHPDATYETPYTSKDYLNFLACYDNQVNHEGVENLGYQRRPLQNPYLDFNIKK